MAGETTALAISVEQEQAIQTGRNQLLTAATALVIDSPEAEQAAWKIVNGIAALKERIEDDFAASKKAAHKAWKAVCAQEQGHLAGLIEPNRIVRAKIEAWKLEQDRLRKKAEEDARAAAEAERLEKVRQAEEQVLAEAGKAEEAGDTELAQEILEAPLVVEPVAPIAPVAESEKVQGAGVMVKVWCFEVVDARKVPRDFLTVDLKAIQRAVATLKQEAEIPGVRVYSELRARRKGS